MKTKHFVTLGHIDHGKSSLLGRLLWDLGKIGSQTKSYLRKIGSKDGRQFAFVLDQRHKERSQGITIDVGHNKLLIDGYAFTFSDAPGHQVYFAKTAAAITQANGAIWVLAADEGLTPTARKHALRAQTRGIRDFIVVISKMDLVNYRQDRYSQLARQALSLLKGAKPQILPVSALKGQNISRASPRMPWFAGNNFLQCLKLANPLESSLDDLVSESTSIIRKAVNHFKHPVMLWAGGKDSTAQIAIARSAFNERLPFPLLFIDTTYKFAETYRFIAKLEADWNLPLLRTKNTRALAAGITPWSVSHFRYCHELKTKPLLDTIVNQGFDCVFTGIRWDEHGIRGKEQYFSSRADPPHTRVHPMLHWSEAEIWQYLKEKHIPYNPLYDKVDRRGRVYRSIGCWPFTQPVSHDAVEERGGRQLDKERLMEDLRSLGYM